ncbi:MAG: flagellar biosynthesis protein FlhA [Planctomycetaceae bacterium]|jgi:flagellar biosynthesis protein FlhA|nr:flagellar biosynthesis protein FlhA [Planctomycetaceae bacterium]
MEVFWGQLQLLFRARGRLIDLLLPLTISASILIIFVPLHPFVMDVLLSLNISLAVIILLTTLFVSKPLDFSIFPTILLATTLFRLVLNIASTRLILTRANEDGELAAGEVIKNFADFVASGNIVVGFILFAIIVVIQFVVITKGATRVAEVAARFTLDAMPGRQMAIDADLNAGLIDEAEAKRRREEIQLSADFFGAMDGAGKFVRGDAIAGIVITLINIIGGLFIGVMQYGMDFQTAGRIFTKLTIGDGLVSQVPALMISIATGLLVTRSSHSLNLPQQFIGQMLSKPIVLVLTGVFLSLLMLTELPKLPLFSIAASSIAIGFIMSRKTKTNEQAEAAKRAETAAEQSAQAAAAQDEKAEDFLKVDPMELELGVGLVPLADVNKGGDLLSRIDRLRKEVAAEIGIIFPKIRIRDSFHLDQIQYQFRISGQPITRGVVYPDLFLAMPSGAETGQVNGIETIEPAFGTTALWVDAATKDQAEIYGYYVVEPSAVIVTHLSETVRKYADELLTRDATQHLIDQLKEISPTVVNELIPNLMSLSLLQQVLQRLLREQVPIRQLDKILEVLGDNITRTKDPILLVEEVRRKLARTICTKYRDTNNMMNVVTLDPALESQILAGFEYNENGLFSRLSPDTRDNICRKMLPELEKLTQLNLTPVVLVDPRIRFFLKQLTNAMIPSLVVISYNELTVDTQVTVVGYVNP